MHVSVCGPAGTYRVLSRDRGCLVITCVVQAFVVFGNPEEALRACLKDREIFCDGDKFGDRYVRVYPTVESDLPDIQECLTLATSSQGQEASPCMLAALMHI